VRFCILILILCLVILAGCSGSSSSSHNSVATLAGNWQIALTPNDQANFQPRALSGFLQQTDQNITGSVTFLIPNPQNPAAPLCAGNASISGKVDGESVSLSVNQNGQMLTLAGNPSSDGSSISGTYSSPDGACEPSEAGAFTAILIKPITGDFQGVFHSTSSNSYSLQFKDFAVGGNLVQTPNSGASSASVTGLITAVDYQCFATASLNGTISGSNLRLSIIGFNGVQIGEMGAAVGQQSPGAAIVSADGGTIRGSNSSGTGYFIANTKACPFVNSSFDYGDFCLNLGDASTCQEPLSATPNNFVFPPLLVGDSSGPTEILTLSNQTSGGNTQTMQVSISILGLTGSDSPNDFNIVSQSCDSTQTNWPPQGPLQITLTSQASCTLGLKFVPIGSCPSDPTTGPPAKCPLPRTAQLQLMDNLDPTIDQNNPHAVSLVGTGYSAIVPSIGELDFLSSQANVAQTIMFTNQSQAPTAVAVSILPVSINGSTQQPCTYPPSSGAPSGLQVVDFINQSCDGTVNSLTGLQNFTLQSDNCSGKTVNPGDSCTVDIVFTPQTTQFIDVFLQINSSEPDSGRFVLELKGNVATPAARAAKKRAVAAPHL
jgi:hypothetical protein